MRDFSDVEACYFRYIPLSRIHVPVTTEKVASSMYSFPSLSLCDEIEKVASRSLIQCKFGSVEAAAKV